VTPHLDEGGQGQGINGIGLVEDVEHLRRWRPHRLVHLAFLPEITAARVRLSCFLYMVQLDEDDAITGQKGCMLLALETGICKIKIMAPVRGQNRHCTLPFHSAAEVEALV
jgi:hypothetical protein